MNTTYRKPIVSPFQTMSKNAFNTQDKKHPINEEIKKSLGTYNFTATFESDTRTLEKFKHITGIVAIICTLKKGNEVVGEGRGTSVLSKVNRYLERTVRYAFNASLLDAVARSAKMLDSLHLDENLNHEVNVAPTAPVEVYKIKDTEGLITDKQKKYLLELIKIKVSDKDEQDQWKIDVERLTKDEASLAIQNFS